MPDEKAIDAAVQLLKAAKRPLVCIAAGANRKRVQKMVRHMYVQHMANVYICTYTYIYARVLAEGR